MISVKNMAMYKSELRGCLKSHFGTCNKYNKRVTLKSTDKIRIIFKSQEEIDMFVGHLVIGNWKLVIGNRQ